MARKRIPQIYPPKDIIQSYSNVKPKNTVGIWTPEEDKLLYELYFERNEKMKMIISILGRSKGAIEHRVVMTIAVSKQKPLTDNWIENNRRIRNYSNYVTLMGFVKHAAKLRLITYQLC